MRWLVVGPSPKTQPRSAAMAYSAITLPRTSAPPPDSALPILPALKTRNGSTLTPPTMSHLPSTSQTPSRLAIRTPSKPTISPSTRHAKSTPVVPTLRSISTTATPQEKSVGTEIRRSISITSFPQPPGVRKQIAGTNNTGSQVKTSSVDGRSQSSSTNRAVSAGGRSRLKRLRIVEDPPSTEAGLSRTFSGQHTGHDEPVRSEVNMAEDRDSRATANSPIASRSSSAEDSCSTSATTFEDVDDARRGREEVDPPSSKGTRSTNTKEAKGNVIVSVRVRPDAGGNGDNSSEGEWMVDGRRSLVAYRGREGGDYYYGLPVRPRFQYPAHYLP